MASDKAKALAEQLSNVAKEIRNDTTLGFESDSEQRAKLIDAAKSIINAVNQPTDTFVDQSANICQLTASRLFIQWKAFEKIPQEGSISFKDLAAKLDADVSLITRFGSMLTATGYLNHVGTDRVAHTATSRPLATSEASRATVRLMFDGHIPGLLGMPSYFTQHGLREPVGRHNTIFAHAAGSPDATVWDIMNRDHDRMVDFMLGMSAFEEVYPAAGSYDFGWAVKKATAESGGDDGNDRTVLVDVGGGKGHAVKAIRAETPGLRAEWCVVEDLPAVIEQAKAMDDPELRGARFVGMDFHEEQPIKGAMIYYIRRCLHDYGDDECVSILQQISAAMAPDSRLLIVEQVMGTPPSPFAAMADFLMATIGGKERSLETFRAITSKARLMIEAVHRSPGSDVAVIECVKEKA